MHRQIFVCLSLFSVTVINTTSKSNMGKKFIWLTFPHWGKQSLGKSIIGKVYHWGKSEQEPRKQEAGAKGKAMEECYLLACALQFAQPSLLSEPGRPAQEQHYSQQTESSYINHNQEKAPQTHLQAIGWRCFFQLRLLFPNNSDLHQVDTKQTRTLRSK